uniref:Uncharacterized protein n=1 Tax=Strongyloides papillosus TaxID=174720 RepID=A0A0N5BML2_STREA
MLINISLQRYYAASELSTFPSNAFKRSTTCSSFVSLNLSIKEVAGNLNKPIDVSAIQPLINPKPSASHLAKQYIDYFAEFDVISTAIFLCKIDPVGMILVDPSPKLQLFDLFYDKSISKSDRALEGFSRSMRCVQTLKKEG